MFSEAEPDCTTCDTGLKIACGMIATCLGLMHVVVELAPVQILEQSGCDRSIIVSWKNA
jgi:hypothetical protein